MNAIAFTREVRALASLAGWQRRGKPPSCETHTRAGALFRMTFSYDAAARCCRSAPTNLNPSYPLAATSLHIWR